MTLQAIFSAVEALPAKIAALFEGATKAAAKAAEQEQLLITKDARIAELEAQSLAQAGKISELVAAAGNHATALAGKDAEIAALKAASKSVEQRTVEQVASLGIAPLPAADDASRTGAETVDSLRAKLANETDPQKRIAMARQLRDLRGHKNLFG